MPRRAELQSGSHRQGSKKGNSDGMTTRLGSRGLGQGRGRRAAGPVHPPRAEPIDPCGVPTCTPAHSRAPQVPEGAPPRPSSQEGFPEVGKTPHLVNQERSIPTRHHLPSGRCFRQRRQHKGTELIHPSRLQSRIARKCKTFKGLKKACPSPAPPGKTKLPFQNTALSGRKQVMRQGGFKTDAGAGLASPYHASPRPAQASIKHHLGEGPGLPGSKV